MFIYLR